MLRRHNRIIRALTWKREAGEECEKGRPCRNGRRDATWLALTMEEGSHKSSAVGYPEGGKGRMRGPAPRAMLDAALPVRPSWDF